MSDFRDSYSPPLLETIPPKSLSPPPVYLKRKKPDVLPLSPQRPDTASVSPVLTPMGPGTDELDTIWEPASQLSPFLAAHDMTYLSPQHSEIIEMLLDRKEKLQEQLSEKNDQNRFLQQDLSCCTRERDVLIAQLNQLTPTLSESQLEELDGLWTCPESDLLSIELRARRFWDEFLHQRERANAQVLLEHLGRLVSRHEGSLRSTVVKQQTAQNRVFSEFEVFKALKCLFNQDKTLDCVKDNLKLQVARTKELEDQLTEREREIEAIRFEMEELRLISESQLEQSTQQLDDFRMSDFRDSYSPPLLETIPPKSLSPPPVYLKRKKPDVLPLSPQRPDTASVSPVLTHMGPGTDELDTIWEPASQLSPFLAAQHDMTSLSPQHSEILERSLDQKEKLQEQLSGKDDQNRFLQQDLSPCTRERDVLIAQLNQLTPTLSESQLEELDGLRTCPESDLLPMEPRARRGWEEFSRQRRELETQRDIVSERDNEVRDLISERSNIRVLLEHLERLVSRHERSLRSTVVKRQTAQNGVSSEVEVLKALKCLFDHHKTLDLVKDKLEHQVARTKELEDQLTEALAQRLIEPITPLANQLIEPITPLANQLIEPITPLANQLIEPITPLANQLTNPIDASDNKDLKEKLRCKETETIELREELEEKGQSEGLMKLRLQQTVEKLSLVQKDKMDLEQILHERMEPANQRRGSRRTKKASRQYMPNVIAAGLLGRRRPVQVLC